MTPYRTGQVDREFRRIQRRRDRRTSPARLASLERRALRRQYRRFLITVFVTTITLCAIKDLVLYLLHK